MRMSAEQTKRKKKNLTLRTLKRIIISIPLSVFCLLSHLVFWQAKYAPAVTHKVTSACRIRLMPHTISLILFISVCLSTEMTKGSKAAGHGSSRAHTPCECSYNRKNTKENKRDAKRLAMSSSRIRVFLIKIICVRQFILETNKRSEAGVAIIEFVCVPSSSSASVDETMHCTNVQYACVHFEQMPSNIYT